MIIQRKPDWLKIRLTTSGEYAHVKEIVRTHKLHTICQSGDCPNMGECWSNGTATFMILGNICTRACRFCNVPSGKPLPIDEGEPLRVAMSIKLMGLKHAVITSVDRDDMPDLGARAWAETIREVKRVNPSTTLEVLIPDFQGKSELIQLVIDAKPDIISHNMETVRRLTPQIRTRAKYDISLLALRYIATQNVVSKSGIMLGLGETEEEVIETMDDLRDANCKILTIGQYLRPTKENIEVQEYVHPDQFTKLREIALSKGFTHVESAPLVRSSYHAEKHI